MKACQFLLLFFTCFVSYSSFAVVPQIERDALIALYQSTNGDEWFENSNWGVGDPCDNEWFGVYCSENTVTGVELFENNLTGQIPVQIDQLPNLTYLDLSENNLNGNIPSGLFNLTSLTGLYLNNNNLNGSISSQIGTLTNLQELALGFNDLAGVIPTQIGNLTNLTYLSLTHANLYGEIPDELGNLINLNSLYLFDNQLTGEIPATIGSLTQLRSLHLFKNQLVGELPSEIGNLTQLRSFYLLDNQLRGEIPVSIINLDQLIFFDYQNNALYSTNAAVNELLYERTCFDYGFSFECPSIDSQTLAPRNFHLVSSSGDSVALAWDQVSYNQPGGYQLWMSESEDGPYRMIHETNSKAETSHEISSLSAGTEYYFQLKTFTNAYADNRNLVFSDAINLDGVRSADIQYPMESIHSGSWYNPAQDGHGLVVEVLANDVAVVYWYVYDNEGNQMWLVGAGPYDGNDITANMSVSSGGMFPPEFDSTEVSNQFWGTLTLTFTDQASMKAAWVPKRDTGFQVGQLNMQQFTRVSNSADDNDQNKIIGTQVQSAHSGSWFNPEQSGHGLVVEILPNNFGLIYWYVFDDAGNQVWLVGSGTYQGSQLDVTMSIVTGAMFPPAFDSNDRVVETWGTASLNFADCNQAEFTWQPTINSTAFTAGDMLVQRLTGLAGLNCSD